MILTIVIIKKMMMTTIIIIIIIIIVTVITYMYIKSYPQNVAKISRECKNMDIINADEGYDMFALSSTGGERIYSVDFYPDWQVPKY